MLLKLFAVKKEPIKNTVLFFLSLPNFQSVAFENRVISGVLFTKFDIAENSI